jgi:hypothetical protein
MNIKYLMEELKYQWWKQKQKTKEEKESLRKMSEWYQTKRREADGVYRKEYKRQQDPYGVWVTEKENLEVGNNQTKKVE